MRPNFASKKLTVVGSSHRRLELIVVFPSRAKIVTLVHVVFHRVECNASLTHLLHFKSAVNGWLVAMSPSRSWEISLRDRHIGRRRWCELAVGARLVSHLGMALCLGQIDGSFDI
jgi:hypothetical protein